MKRFLRNVLLFLLPFVGAGAVLAMRPLDRSFAYRYLKGDCGGQARWIYDRIVENRAPIDVAFLGTSRTIRAVDDAAIERRLADRGVPVTVANFGYCRPGRDLQRAIADLLLSARAVRLLVVEVDDTENPNSHPVQGYIAEGDALVPPFGLWHREVPSDLVQAFEVRFEAARQRLLLGDAGLRPYDPDPHGFRPVGEGTPPPAYLARRRRERQARARRSQAYSRRTLAFPRYHLQAIARRCRDQGIVLAFLYLQSYGEPWASMREGAFYRSLAPVWIPPREVFEDPAMWKDDAHLNDRGSRTIVPWFADRIAAALPAPR